MRPLTQIGDRPLGAPPGARGLAPRDVGTKGVLYDLQEDPLETVNLAADTAYQDLVLEMRSRLFEELEATGGMWVPLREPRGFRGDLRREDCPGGNCYGGDPGTR